MSDQKI